MLHNKLRALEWVEEPLPAPLRSIALSRNGEVSFLEGKLTVADQAGKTFPQGFAPSDYVYHLVEHVVPGSYMKLVRLRGECGPEFVAIR